MKDRLVTKLSALTVNDWQAMDVETLKKIVEIIENKEAQS